MMFHRSRDSGKLGCTLTPIIRSMTFCASVNDASLRLAIKVSDVSSQQTGMAASRRIAGSNTSTISRARLEYGRMEDQKLRYVSDHPDNAFLLSSSFQVFLY